MKIILLKDIAKVGKRYETKDISDGYAANMLIPRGLAVAATPDAIKRFQKEKSKEDGQRAMQEELFVKSLKDLEKVILTISGKASDKGHLFAGLHREVIAEELLKQTRLSVSPSFIQLEHPIKEIGEYKIEVKGAGKSGSFRLRVQSSSSL